MVKAGWRLPFGRRVAIDREAFRKLVGQMWVSVPQAIKQAEELAVERDRYITQAQQEAQEIIAQARQDAARLTDEHVVLAQAQARADELLAHAERQSALIRSGADEYAEQTLRDLAEQVEQLQRVIVNGIGVLAAHRQEQAAVAAAPAADGTAQAGPPQTPITQPEQATAAQGS